MAALRGIARRGFWVEVIKAARLRFEMAQCDVRLTLDGGDGLKLRLSGKGKVVKLAVLVDEEKKKQ